MAATKLAIHIPPDANPKNIIEMIVAISNSKQAYFKSVGELLSYTEIQGISSRGEMQLMASNIGLLHKTSEGIGLSEEGLLCARLREDIRPEILHYQLYTGWSEKKPLTFLPSWSYRYCCDYYWETSSVHLSGAYLDRQVAEIINQARENFSQMNLGEVEEISFSRMSLRGARKWLEILQPSVVEGEHFTRRTFCSPELLLLAIGYILGEDPDPIGVDILLSREKRERICKICLLDPASFDQVLDWTIPIFPNVISPGTSAGFYGRFIRLHKQPMLEDLLR